MTRILTIACLLTLLLPGAAMAAPWQPFGDRAETRSRSLVPVTWGPDAAEEGQRKVAQDHAGEGGKPAAPPVATAPSPAASAGALVPEGGECKSDAQCAEDTYCDNGRCRRVEKEINILYLYYMSGDRKFTEVLGVYWHQRGDDGYRVVFPFYWRFWEPGHDNLVIPPFQYRETPREKNYRFWPLVFWTDYGERGYGVTVLPFFHRAREGTRTSTIIPVVLSGYDRDPAKQYSRGMVLGLFYWHDQGDHSTRALFPFFYRSASPERAFAWILPLNFYWRTEQDKTVLALPFVYASTGPTFTQVLNLVPPLHYSRQGDSKKLVILPLFWHKTSPEESYTVFFPVVWHFSSPGRSTTIAGPVFHYRRGTRTTAGVLPLALYHSDQKDGSRFGFIFPLAYYSASDKERRSLLISPLFAYERDDQARVKHWGLIAPPFYHRRDSEREIDALIPLFLRWHNSVEGSTTYMVGPVVFHDDPEGGTQVAFPLFWRFSDNKTGAATSVLFPLAFRHRRPDGSHFNLFFPFFFSVKDLGWSAGLFPLLWLGDQKDRRHGVLFPVFWHFKAGKRSTTVLGPAYYRRTEKSWHAGLAPLLFLRGGEDGESHQVLFPAFWHLRSEKEGYNTYVAGPGFYSDSRKGRVFGVVPLFAAGTWKGSRFQAVLPPLFYHSENEQQRTSTLLVGPYYHWTDKDVSGHALVPLGFYRTSDEKTTAAVLPLFYFSRDRKEHKDLLVTPLGGYRKDNKRLVNEGLAGPVAWHLGPDLRGYALLPLFYHWSRPKKQSTTTVVLPFFVRHVSPTESAHVVFPLVWRFTEPGESSLVVFPFYWRLRQDKGTDVDVAFPLYWHIRNRDGKRWTRVIGPVFARKTEKTYRAGVAPLAYYQRNKRGSMAVSLPFVVYRNNFSDHKRTWVVGPFYYQKWDEGKIAGLLPLFFYKRSPDSDYTVALPLVYHFGNPKENKSLTFVGTWFYRKSGQDRATGVVPLFYTSWDNIGGRSVAVFPLFYHRTEVARSALYTPLFGFDRSPERSQWYAGIFFRRTSQKRNINVLFPLFLYYRNHEEGQTTTAVVPFYLGQWSREKSFHLVFPLFWRWRSVDSTTTIVLPIYWDFNDEHLRRTTVVFPIFLRHRDALEKSTSWVVPPVWVRTRPDATDAVVFPLVWHFGGTQESTTIGAPLYYDFKSPGKRSTVFFPFFWRFDRPGELTYVVFNTYYRQSKRDETYRLFIFPLVDVERKRPGDIDVDILAGLFGYERIGRNRTINILFIPFKLQSSSGQTLNGFGGTRNVSFVQ